MLCGESCYSLEEHCSVMAGALPWPAMPETLTFNIIYMPGPLTGREMAADSPGRRSELLTANTSPSLGKPGCRHSAGFGEAVTGQRKQTLLRVTDRL